MPTLIPVQYAKRKYPEGITPKLQEVAAHLDKVSIHPRMPYSLHTEYSFGKRRLNSEVVSSFPELVHCHKKGVPQLWKSKRWAEEFADFIRQLVGSNQSPGIIEIHPPFNDYCGSIPEFLEVYRTFEARITEHYPSASIVIENRMGSRYSGGSFLISTAEDLRILHEQVQEMGLQLQLVLDFPQLFTAHRLTTGKFSPGAIRKIMRSLCPLQESINGIHIWGKKDYGDGVKRAHMGDLDTYFEDQECKDVFLEEVKSLLKDDRPILFVPEVNSDDEDLRSIIEDLQKVAEFS